MYYNGSSWVSQIPYAGATANVDLGTNTLTAGSLSSNNDISVNGIRIGRGNSTHQDNNRNLAIGINALNSNSSTSYENTAIGYQSGQNVNFNGNTSIGYNSLSNATNSIHNTGVGAYSLNQVRSTVYFNGGSSNIGIGWSGGGNITTGSKNIAIGWTSYVPNATGDNQFVLASSLYGTNIYSSSAQYGINTSTPAYNFDINGTARIANTPTITTATKALVKDPSTGQISEQNLPSISNLVPYTGATGNVDLGTNNLMADSLTSTNDISVNGMRIGRGKGNNNTNQAIGNQALYSNTSGANNIANGVQTLQYNTSGSFNIGIGNRALHFNQRGDYNTANGYDALYYSSGSDNTALGYYAGRNLSAGSYNIAIGSTTNFPSTTGSYQLNIGNEIYGKYVGDPFNTVQISIGTDTPNGSNMLTVAGTIYANGSQLSSDRRFKKDIQAINLGLKEVLQLKPSSYYWNTKNERMTNADPIKLQYGFIAQELEAVIPAVVSGDGSEKDYKSVNYEALIPVLTKAIQEQQELIDALKKRNEAMEKKIDVLEKKINSSLKNN
jgi:hypothetical protein